MDPRNRSRAGRFPRLIAALGVCLASATPAGAQYMYLDSNGDGVHTSEDVVDPNSMSVVGVWLVTDRNRDGTPAACQTGGTIAVPDFRIVLVTKNGTVSWGEFIPDQKGLTNFEPVCEDFSRKVIWFALPEALHPGRHYLGKIPIIAMSGTPSIELGTGCLEGHEQFTGFSSKCEGQTLCDEHVLGEGGFEADGLPFGGTANNPPVLTAPIQLPVKAGSEARYRITAHDKDGDPITFRLGSALQRLSSPSFATVRTIDPGHGDAIGEVVLTPDSCQQAATALFALEAWDGTWSDHIDVAAPVERMDRPVPENPMNLPVRSLSGKEDREPPWRGMAPSRAVLDGEWEWTGIASSGQRMPTMFPSRSGPARSGRRRRLVLSADRSFSIYELSRSGIELSAKGEYSLGKGPGGEFIELEGGKRFAIWRSAKDTLCLYPWQAHDAAASYYVAVPELIRNPSHLDTLTLLNPLGLPRAEPSRLIQLRASLRGALRRHDSSFRPYGSGDWPFPGNVEFGDSPWRGIGDFDGDLMQDLVLYGRSGKDEVVLAVLSGFGRTRVVEVARRPAEMKWPHPYLEVVPRGAEYPPCWARRGVPETDAIGIVSPGIARFDYALANGVFVLYAPTP